MDVFEIQDRGNIVIQIFEGTDDLERIHHSGVFFLELLLLFFQETGMFLDLIDSGESRLDIHWLRNGLLGFIELFIKTVNDCQVFPVRIDFQKR